MRTGILLVALSNDDSEMRRDGTVYDTPKLIGYSWTA